MKTLVTICLCLCLSIGLLPVQAKTDYKNRKIASVDGPVKAPAGVPLSEIGFQEEAPECWDTSFGFAKPQLGGPVIRVILETEGKVYVGGSFSMAGNTPVNSIAMWDGNAWSDVGGGVTFTDEQGNVGPGGISEIVIKNGELYVGGAFDKAGGVPVSNLAKWDGNAWSDVGGGTNSWVSAIAFQGDDLLAVGNFKEVGSPRIEAWGIARYDGTQWSEIGGGGYHQEPEGDVSILMSDIEVQGDDIYIAGSITYVGGRPLSSNRGQYVGHIAKWDGSSWENMDGGVHYFDYDPVDFGRVEDILVEGNNVYAAGYFRTAGRSNPIEIYNLAKWDGSQWVEIGNAKSQHSYDYNRVYALAKNGDELYIGGAFIEVDGVAAENIAKWDGSTWTNIGSVGESIYTMYLGNNGLYIGGSFFEVEGAEASRIARYSCVKIDCTEKPMAMEMKPSQYEKYNISCNGSSDGKIEVEIKGGCPEYTYSWSNGATTEDLSGLTAGTYELTVTDANGNSMTQSVTLTEPPAMQMTTTSNQTVYYGYGPAECVELKAEGSGGVPGYSYSWNTGETSSSITVCPQETKEYEVTMKDSYGCTVTKTIRVCVVDVHCGNNMNKVEVCHIPPGNPSNAHTICIAESAVAAHLAHGDQLGACGEMKACGEKEEPKEESKLAVNQEEELNKNQIKTYPNPFNHSVKLQFSLPYSDNVKLKVYDLKGNEIETLFEGQVKPGKQYEVEFSPVNKLTNGMYFYHLIGSQGVVEQGKMILVR